MKTYRLKEWALLLCFFHFGSGYAQNFPGFSKVFRSDLIASSYRSANITVLLYDSTQQALYYAMKVVTMSAPERGYTQFYKSSLDGTTQATRYDTQAVYSISYSAAATDGQYIYWLGAKVQPGVGSQSRIKVLKTDMNLVKIWEKEYNPRQKKKQRILLLDKAHLLLSSGDLFKTELYKIDSTGTVLYHDTAFSKDYIRGLALKDDHSFLFSGRSNSSAVDSNMQITWSEPNGGAAIAASKEGAGYFYVCGGAYTDIPEWIDGGYINGTVQKITMDGHTAGRAYYTLYKAGSSVYTALDDGYQSVCIATINGCAAVARASQSSAPIYFGEINRIDSSLHSIWNYGYTYAPGKTSTLSQIVGLPDGSFVASGWAEALSPSGSWEQQGWLLRVDSNGCYDSTCAGRIPPEPSGITGPGRNELSITPNPAGNMLEIRLREPFLSDAAVYITDVSGRSVHRGVIPAGKPGLSINVRAWVNGIYFINLTNKGNRFYQKLVVQH
ncbi:T9SS type A sorting domain-containing protein [Taibaiella chishuiensis]|uniref:T9SS type A sorting domain-containing protein n=1 Tax=Taibaiella chishuiensis TaxID=1434707 RepID=UPI000D0D3013|nr:T9SS type A sorting domain-containing protein [Taibaiella chishuiensis]